MTAREREPELIAMPPCESAAADAEPITRIWLTWGAGAGSFQVAARLISLHRDRVSLTCPTPPPPGRQAVIVLETRDRREHTALATVAAVRALGRGVSLVRLRFAGACQRAFWEVASACLELIE
jgi:hypothetical protein